MKRILIFIIILIANNSIAQKNTIIPYLLNIETESSIYEYIKTKKKDSIGFLFEKVTEKKYIIHLSSITSRFANSNRKLFINNRFYPIIFDTDYMFYVKIKDDFPVITKYEDDSERKSKEIIIPNIEERLKNKELYSKNVILNIIDWSINWTIDEKGKLLETNSK